MTKFIKSISYIPLIFFVLLSIPLFVPQTYALETPINLLREQAENTAEQAQQAQEAAQSTSDVLIDNNTIIETSKDTVKDDDIKRRIQSIFAEIASLQKVTVLVSEGVVTLSGQVPNEAQAQTAARLAKRTKGVVAVQDSIERTLTIQENLSPVLRDLKHKTASFMKALPLMGIALVVFVGMFWLGRFIASFTRLWQRILPNPFVTELFSQAIYLVFVVSGLVVALSILGAKALIGTLLGGAGVLGIAVGFAVRDSIENYISSIMLSIRQPFRAGDHVVINDLDGIVVRLTSRATILMTLEGNHLRIPNAQVFKGIILNYSTNPERKFSFELGVDADDDPVAAMKVGLDAIKMHDFVLADPPPTAIIKTVGDSNIVIDFSAWVNQQQADFFKARSLSIRSAKYALEDCGFSLPEPIYRLRFDTNLTKALEDAAQKGASLQVGGQLAERHHAEVNLTDSEVAEVMDVRPDTHLKEKVDIERMTQGEKDLLDEKSPKE